MKLVTLLPLAVTMAFAACQETTAPRRSVVSSLAVSPVSVTRTTDLGTLGGSLSYSNVGSVNNRGQVVGFSTTAREAAEHAFLWQNGKMTDLGTLGGSTSIALAINAGGQVVGDSETATGEQHGFLWENGTMTDLGTLGGCCGNASAINNRGQIVGGSLTTSGEDHPVLWRK